MQRVYTVALWLAISVALTAPSAAQEKPASAPTLSDVQILKVQNAAQRIEIAQLRAALAQQEYERAREAATKLVQALQVPGYVLDLERFVYVEKPAAKE